MNILIVSQPARDGVLRHVGGLVDFLLSQGDRVHLAYSDLAASDQLHALVDRVRSAGGACLNLAVGNAPHPRDVSAVLGLHSLIRRERPDVIHAHSSKAGALVRGLGLLGLPTPLFYTPHSYYRMHDTKCRKVRAFHALERIFSRVGTTITMSHCEAKFAERVIGVPSSRKRVIANGVDFGTFRPPAAEDRRELRARFGLPLDAKILGSVGRFSLQKDPLSMYAAFARVALDMPEVHFAHLGQGELEPEVDALIAAHGIADRCHRLPYLDDTAPFYRVLDGFLLTSLYEGMSYAVLEALASNLPLILTRAPGNRDFGGHEISHLGWCEPGNVTSIAAAIVAWRQTLDLPEAPNHRAIASARFSLEVCFPAVREAYRGALSPAAGAP